MWKLLIFAQAYNLNWKCIRIKVSQDWYLKADGFFYFPDGPATQAALAVMVTSYRKGLFHVT